MSSPKDPTRPGIALAPASPPMPRHRGREALPDAILLDAWLTTAPPPQGQPLASLIHDLAPCLPKVRSDAIQRQLAVLSCLLANFISTHPLAPPAIAVPQAKLKATRYDNAAITGRQLKPTLDGLEAAGMIVRSPAIFKHARTIVQPTARLIELIAAHHVTAASIIRLPGEEVILLRKRKARNASVSVYGDDGAGEPFTATNNQVGSFIDYPHDCREANALRIEMRSYNEFLFKSDIRVMGIDNPPPPKPFKRIFATSGPVQFNLHGRLYAGQVGGWHQGLPKTERHLIRINGESIVEIDWQSLHLRLAYVEAQCSPPAGDLYAVPGLEPYRPALKIVCSAMLSIAGELTKLPPSVREASPDLPKQWTARRIAQAVKQHHAPIAHLFGRDRGIAYMLTDATLLMMVLTRLMDRGLPALPLHDAILVQQSARDTAMAAMQDASMELLGVALPVSLKG